MPSFCCSNMPLALAVSDRRVHSRPAHRAPAPHANLSRALLSTSIPRAPFPGPVPSTLLAVPSPLALRHHHLTPPTLLFALDKCTLPKLRRLLRVDLIEKTFLNFISTRICTNISIFSSDNGLFHTGSARTAGTR